VVLATRRIQKNHLSDGLDILFILFDPLIFEEEDEVDEVGTVRCIANWSFSSGIILHHSNSLLRQPRWA